MDEDTIADFKQFMTATISQQTAVLNKKIDGLSEHMTNLDKTLNKKIDDLSSFVADALDSSNEVIDAQLKDHERRITKLEHKATA